MVGDVAILYNRSLYVDYTLPFIESGVSVVVPIEGHNIENAWFFLETLDMGPLGEQSYILCFHWICCLGS